VPRKEGTNNATT